MKKVFNARLWLVLEPVILLVIFSLLARQIAPYWGVAPAATDLALSTTPPDWRSLAVLEGKSQLIKWGMLIAVVALIASLRGYNIMRPVGGDRPSLSLFQLILLGLAVAVPLHVISILPRWYHFNVALLGEAPVIWSLIYGSEWTLEFWAFMAISSFVIAPIVEELFFRGYLLGGLYRKFSPFWAVVISAFVFAVVHLQYLGPSPFEIYNMTMVFIIAAGYAWVVIMTRSLIPVIIGHAYGNIPQPLDWALYEAVLIAPAAAAFIYLLRRARN